jgi:hypothetical protein
MATDPGALICECSHQKDTHILSNRQCQGEVFVDGMKRLESCTCPRFKLWYNDDELTESEKEYIDGE